MLTRSRTVLAVAVAIVAGCQAANLTTSVAPASPAVVPTPTLSFTPTATASPGPILAGRILFHRSGPDEVEHYFTIDADGTDEKAINTTQGCACASWSADGSRVHFVGATGLGTWSLLTMKPDGSDPVVIKPPIKTLNLFVGASSADGRRISFWGMDEKDPSNTGLYLASPDLGDLRLVTRLPDGVEEIAPFGVTPDGSRIVFLAQTGPYEGMTHAGDLYVIDADGTGLRRLNPAGTTLGDIGRPPVSVSPDGRHATFGVDHAVWVVDLAGGEARRVTKGTGFVWAVSWSPAGDWITYTRFHGATSVVALVRPDGTDDHEISMVDETDEANAAAWSPDGKYLLVQRDADGSVDGPRDLWIMDLTGTWVGQVTHEPSNYGTYSWALAADS